MHKTFRQVVSTLQLHVVLTVSGWHDYGSNPDRDNGSAGQVGARGSRKKPGRPVDDRRGENHGRGDLDHSRACGGELIYDRGCSFCHCTINTPGGYVRVLISTRASMNTPGGYVRVLIMNTPGGYARVPISTRTYPPGVFMVQWQKLRDAKLQLEP